MFWSHRITASEAASAIDLAELFVEALEKSKTPVSSVILDRFDEVGLHAYFDHFHLVNVKENLTKNYFRTTECLHFIYTNIFWSCYF